MNDRIAPLVSLIAKSDKARQKLAPGTWQHAMLGHHLDALRLAHGLLATPADAVGNAAPGDVAPGDLRKALTAFASMLDRSERAWHRSAPGSAQHALLKNRIEALRMAQAAIREVLGESHN